MSTRFTRSGTLFGITILLLIAPIALAFADPEDSYSRAGQEYQDKAAFLCKFAKFVEWPSHKFTQPDSPLIIGVVGADPFGALLEEAAQDNRINDRTVTVRHVESMEELRKCHIIFVCRSESSRLGPILSEVRGDNVLTVGESDQFASRGGMINFIMVGGAVRFQINDSAARHAGIKISSKLQILAVPWSR